MDNSIKERLKELITVLNDTNSTFARRIGLLQGEYVRQILASEKPIPVKTIKRIEDKLPNLNIDWLKHGKGEIFKFENIEEKENIKNHEPLTLIRRESYEELLKAKDEIIQAKDDIIAALKKNIEEKEKLTEYWKSQLQKAEDIADRFMKKFSAF